MRHVVALLLTLLVSSCASAGVATTSDMARLLPGTWAMTTEINGARLEAQTTFTADGNIEERLQVTQEGVVTNLVARGTWKVESDTIVTTYTESNAPTVVAVGSVERDKVTFIDAHQLSLVDNEGTAGTMHRVR